MLDLSDGGTFDPSVDIKLGKGSLDDASYKLLRLSDRKSFMFSPYANVKYVTHQEGITFDPKGII